MLFKFLKISYVHLEIFNELTEVFLLKQIVIKYTVNEI